MISVMDAGTVQEWPVVLTKHSRDGYIEEGKHFSTANIFLLRILIVNLSMY